VNATAVSPVSMAFGADVQADVDPLEQLRGITWRTAPESMLAIAGCLGGVKAQRELCRQWGIDDGLPLWRARRAARRLVRGLRDIAHFAWSNAGETSAWDLFFTNTTFAQAPVIQASATAGSYFITLHTLTGPGAAGAQNTNESAYPNYARVAVARSGAGWTVTGNAPITAENAAAVTFPQSGSGGSTPETQTYFSFGSLTSGAGVVYGFASLTAPLIVSNLVTPSFAINALQNNFT
jgi:hypothetical protein